jgi:hypothetical protein
MSGATAMQQREWASTISLALERSCRIAWKPIRGGASTRCTARRLAVSAAIPLRLGSQYEPYISTPSIETHCRRRTASPSTNTQTALNRRSDSSTSNSTRMVRSAGNRHSPDGKKMIPHCPGGGPSTSTGPRRNTSPRQLSGHEEIRYPSVKGLNARCVVHWLKWEDDTSPRKRPVVQRRQHHGLAMR